MADDNISVFRHVPLDENKLQMFTIGEKREPVPEPEPTRSLLGRAIDSIFGAPAKPETPPEPEAPPLRWPGIKGGVPVASVAFVPRSELSGDRRAVLDASIARVAKHSPELREALEERAGFVEGLAGPLVKLDVPVHLATPPEMREWPGSEARLFGLEEAAAILVGKLDPRHEVELRHVELREFEEQTAAMRAQREAAEAAASARLNAFRFRSATWDALPPMARSLLLAAHTLDRNSEGRKALETFALEVARAQFAAPTIPEDDDLGIVLHHIAEVRERERDAAERRSRQFG